MSKKHMRLAFTAVLLVVIAAATWAQFAYQHLKVEKDIVIGGRKSSTAITIDGTTGNLTVPGTITTTGGMLPGTSGATTGNGAVYAFPSLTTGNGVLISYKDGSLSTGSPLSIYGDPNSGTIMWKVAKYGAQTIAPNDPNAVLMNLYDPNGISPTMLKLTGVDSKLTSSAMYINCFGGTGSTSEFSVAKSGNTSINGTLGVAGAFTPSTLGTEVDPNCVSRTLTSADYGKTIFVTASDPNEICTYTLPANGAAAGSWFRCVVTTATSVYMTMKFQAATASSLIAPGNNAASYITFQNYSGSINMTGATVIFISNGTYWVAINESTGLTMVVA